MSELTARPSGDDRTDHPDAMDRRSLLSKAIKLAYVAPVIIAAFKASPANAQVEEILSTVRETVKETVP